MKRLFSVVRRRLRYVTARGWKVRPLICRGCPVWIIKRDTDIPASWIMDWIDNDTAGLGRLWERNRDLRVFPSVERVKELGY